MPRSPASASLATSLATRLTLDPTAVSAVSASAASDSAKAAQPTHFKPRTPRDSRLPARVTTTSEANLDRLDRDTLSRIICASDDPPLSLPVRSAATLARVNRRLRASVRETGQLPPIGPLLKQSRLVLPARWQAAFEARLPARLATMPAGEQTLAVNQLIDRLTRVPAGQGRSLRFQALLRAAEALPVASAGPAMVRLAQCLPQLAQDDECSDRADGFNAIRSRCSALSVGRGGVLCALAEQIPLLSSRANQRGDAIEALQRQVASLPQQQAARLLKDLLKPITCIGDAALRHGLVDATFDALSDQMPPPLVSDVLCAAADRLNLLTQPEEFRFGHDRASSNKASELMLRLVERASTLPVGERAAVLERLAPLAGLIPPALQHSALTWLEHEMSALPDQWRQPIRAQLARHDAPPLTELPTTLLADMGTVAVNPARGNLRERLARLPLHERADALLAMARKLDEEVPAVVRVRLFKEVFRTAQQVLPTLQMTVLSLMMTRLHLLPSRFAGELAEVMSQLALNWPPAQRLAIVAPIAAATGYLPVGAQSRCAHQLELLTHAMTPGDRLAAMMQRAEALPQMEDRDQREACAAMLHTGIMQLPNCERSSLLPAWIAQLTPFIAGAQREEMLFSIHRETIYYASDRTATAAILQALALHLGNFSDASQSTVATELRIAAHAMPLALGQPILEALALQAAGSAAAGSNRPLSSTHG